MRHRGLPFFASWLLTLIVTAYAPPARANDAPPTPLQERILTGADQSEVAITATFSGSELFVYGAIQRNRFLTEDDAPPDIAIVVEGPSTPIIVRKKARTAGVWVNREAIRIAAAPSYYAVASTQPLEDILSSAEDRINRISLDTSVYILGIPNSAQDPEQFRLAAIRLRQRNGLYRASPGGVLLAGGTLYQASFRLPGNIVEGDYKIRVFLVRDQRIRDRAEITLPVRKEGIERVLYTAAHETPLLYGFGTLLMAVLAGYGAAELFRRLRR